MTVTLNSTRDMQKYLALRAASKPSKPSSSLASGFGLGLGLPQYNPTPAPSGIGYAALIPNAYQILQSDVGVIYSTTMQPVAGNTATTVVSLTDARSSALTAIPVQIKATNALAIGSGGQFSVSFDFGSTYPITGITPTAGTPVALSGLGAGISLTWAAGTVVLNNVWNAAAATWNDRTTNAKNATQATLSRQPIIIPGPNGVPEILFDGVDDFLNSPTVGSLAVMPYQIIVVGRAVSITGNITSFVGGPDNTGTIYFNSGSTLSLYNGAGVAVAFASTARTRISAILITGGTGSLRAGSTSNSGAPNASLSNISRNVGAANTGASQYGNVAILAVIYCPVTTDTVVDSLFSSAYGPGAIAV